MSWMLQEVAARRIPDNFTIVGEHSEGDSGKRSILSYKISRNAYKPIDGDIQRVSDWENPKFRLTNIKEKSVGD